MNNIILTTIIGFITGTFASMGLGGGFILVIYLAFFSNLVQKEVQGINLLFFIPITILAVILHFKNKLIEVKTTLFCSLFGIFGAFLGFFIANGLDNQWLRKAFAVFIILIGIKDFIVSFKTTTTK